MMTTSSSGRHSRNSSNSSLQGLYSRAAIKSHQPILLLGSHQDVCESRVFLRNGTLLHIRPIRISDLPHLQQFFETLSSETRYYRYGQCNMHLTIDRFVHLCRMDFDKDFTFLAVIREETENIVGNLQMNRLSDYDSAELSFLITDCWQGMGVGSHLMDFSLIIAERIKLKTLFMQVMEDNEKMRYLAAKYNFRQLHCAEEDDCELLLERKMNWY